MNRRSADGRWDVPTAVALRRLAHDGLPMGLRALPPVRAFLREVYYDTTDFALRSRGVTCRIRHHGDDHLELSVLVVNAGDGESGVTHTVADLPGAAATEALHGASDPARVLQSIVNPATLGVQLELEMERHSRTVLSRWLRRPRFALAYDVVTVRAAGLSRSFHEVALRSLRYGRPTGEAVARAIGDQYALRSLTIDRRARGEQLRTALESEALARGVVEGNWVSVVALDGMRIAYLIDNDGVRLPIAEGSGEAACRHVLRRGLGSTVGDLRLLSTVHGSGRLQSLEVWVCTRVDRSASTSGGESVSWTTVDKLLAMVGSPAIHDPATLAALTVLSRSSELRSLVSNPATARPGERPVVHPGGMAPAADDHAAGPLLDGAMSLLAFNLRVLELAEDQTVPLLERLRYLAIVSSNLDEFFAVQVGGLKYEDQGESEEGVTAIDSTGRLAAIGDGVRSLVTRQAACAAHCEQLLATAGTRIRLLAELTAADDQHLRRYFRDTVLPYLTPRAVTATPGHSLPLIADQVLSMAVVLRDPGAGSPLHLAELTVPSGLPRFVPLPDGTSFVALEDLIRREASQAYPGRRVDNAHIFRLTRYADLGMTEGDAGDLAQTIEERSMRRRHQAVVRIEVEPTMPSTIRDQLVRELQLEPGARPAALGMADVYSVPGRLDLRAMAELADLPRPELRFPSLQPRDALGGDESLWEALRERDVLLHHPYDAFATSVVRFFNDAADDPDVVAMKATLYRVGERSPVVEALLRAAGSGKDVSVFMELKARFDEQRNIRWARQLEAAGAHVVHGMTGVKNHSKMALIVRREADGPRRYAHVGTGNYNAGTARAYTDLGLLTSNPAICTLS